MYFYNAEQLLCLNLFPIISSKLLKKAFRTISSDSSPCIKRFTQNLTNANHTIQSWQPTIVLLSDPLAHHADLSVVIFLFFPCLPAISLFKHFSHFPSLFFFSSSDQIYSFSQSQETPESCPPKKAVFWRFFGKKISPIACQTYSESYCSSG